MLLPQLVVLKQALNELAVGELRRRLLILVLHSDLNAVAVQKQLYYFNLLVPARVVQGRVEELILEVYVCASLDKPLHDFRVSSLGCYDEGRLRLVILDIDDCVVLQQDVENLQISVSCRIVQCGVPQLVLVVHIRLEVLILEVEDLKHKVVVVGFGALNQLLVVLLLRGPPVLPRVVLPSLQLVKVLLFVQTADRFDLVLLPDIVDLVGILVDDHEALIFLELSD